MILAAPDRLLSTPRLGERVDRPGSQEIRRIFAGDYEVRYAIVESEINVVRVWHTRENR
jgi:plasmid stabilization system protein ParE